MRLAPRLSCLPPRRPSEETEGSETARDRVVKGAVTATLTLTQLLAAANAQSVAQVQRAEDLKSADEVYATEEARAEPTEKALSLSAASVVAPSVSAAEGDKVPDLYRDTFVRYAGYANEVGESFKNIVSRTSYKASYAVAIAYVLADAADKGMKAEAVAASMPPEPAADAPEKNSQVEAAKAAADTLVWQGLASVIIPGFTINRIVALVKKITESVDGKLPAPAKKWAPTLIGLSVIPFIVHPIDEGVTMMLDMTIRNFY